MKAIETEKAKGEMKPETAKKPYERARIDEHEPLEEATASVYYYYTYIL
jgi:hypothetical protein